MSDVMLFGVLNMPYDLAMADDLSRVQFYGRAREAAAELERLRSAVSDLLTSLSDADDEGMMEHAEPVRRVRALLNQ